MSGGINPVQAFLAELKRRRVFRVTLVYGATAFVVIEAADLIFPRLGLPEWTVTLVVGLAIIGFPIALVLAWAFEMTPEGVKRAEPAAASELEAIVGEPPSRRWPAGLLALAGILLFLSAIWFTGGRELLLRDLERGATAPATASTSASMAVAVLPFAVQARPDLAYLGEGMVNLLSTKLDGAGELRSVDPRALLRVVEREGLASGDPDAGREIAELFGANLYVVGDLVEAGGRLQLAAALHDRSVGRAPVGQGAVEGQVDDLFELVDELAARLLSDLSGGPAARVRRIATVTTSSLPALKAFFEGEQLFRRAQFGPAVEAFQHAVEEDSLFALAHYRLSMTAEWNFQDQLARDAAEVAFRYAERLSDRDRRLLEAFLVRRRGSNAEAERQYRSILGTHPDEVEAWLDLGEILFHAAPLNGESFTGSREAMERVLSFDPNHSTSLIHLARVAAYEGNYVELDSLVDRFMILNPSPERTLEIEALRAFAKRDEAQMAATSARLERAEDTGVALAAWATGVYARNLGGVESVSVMLTDPHRSPEARRLGFAWLAHAKLAAGQWAAAKQHLGELADLSEGTALEYRALLSLIPFVPVSDGELRELSIELERLDPRSIAVSDNPSVIFTANDPLHRAFRLYLLGRTRARLGDGQEAARIAERLATVELPRTAGSLASDLALSVESQILDSEGRLAEALAQLEQARKATWYGQTTASPLYSQVAERFARAELLYQLDRFDESLEWYTNLVELSPFELPYLAMSHLRRAEIYDKSGETDRAAEHYAQFIELWANADPEFRPLIEGARERLVELLPSRSQHPD